MKKIFIRQYAKDRRSYDILKYLRGQYFKIMFISPLTMCAVPALQIWSVSSGLVMHLGDVLCQILLLVMKWKGVFGRLHPLYSLFDLLHCHCSGFLGDGESNSFPILVRTCVYCVTLSTLTLKPGASSRPQRLNGRLKRCPSLCEWCHYRHH